MEQLVNVSPESVLADDNSRFNLKKTRIDSLANNILEVGGVLSPIEVEVLEPAQNGFKYRLTAGFYRHAAVAKLNAEQQAGLTLPAIVRETPDGLMRLRHQLAENMERENQSPMDKAVAIKKLLDAGISRVEVRRIFSASGGRKGNQVQPMSNAMLNITLRFLELPKAIQEKIHDGRVGVAAAYELGKVPPEKRAAVLEKAEADRVAQIEREEKDEERYLLAEKKLTEAQEKEKEATSKVAETKAAITAAGQMVKDKEKALREIQKEPFLELDAAGKKAVTEKLNAAVADMKAAQKLERDSKNTLAKLLKQADSASEVADAQRARLEAARKAVKSGDKKADKDKVGPEDVKKAARNVEGASAAGYIPLNLSSIRDSLKDVMQNKEFPKVSAVAKAFKDCFDGKDTPKEVIHRLAVITGEAAPDVVPARVKK